MKIEYHLRKTSPVDSAFCYNTKKTVLYDYVKAIWGWDEQEQIRFHNENFHPGFIYIIMASGEDIGTVEIVESEQSIFISSLYILPGWQGKGIGSNIIRTYMDLAKQQGKRIALEVLKLNTRAQQLYSRLGFEITERDQDKYFMFKDVNA